MRPSLSASNALKAAVSASLLPLDSSGRTKAFLFSNKPCLYQVLSVLTSTRAWRPRTRENQPIHHHPDQAVSWRLQKTLWKWVQTSWNYLKQPTHPFAFEMSIFSKAASTSSRVILPDLSSSNTQNASIKTLSSSSDKTSIIFNKKRISKKRFSRFPIVRSEKSSFFFSELIKLYATSK